MKDFPKDPDLDALVTAFLRGDYGAVRTGAPTLAQRTQSDEVKNAARELLRRTQPDRLSVALLVVTGILLILLSGYWMAHNHSARAIGSSAPRVP